MKYTKHIKKIDKNLQGVDQMLQYNNNSEIFSVHFNQYFNQKNPQHCREIMKLKIIYTVKPIGYMETWGKASCENYERNRYHK